MAGIKLGGIKTIKDSKDHPTSEFSRNESELSSLEASTRGDGSGKMSRLK